MPVFDAPASGDFDPIPAKFYEATRDLSNRSPRVLGWTLLCERHLMVMSGMTREAMIQQRQDAGGMFVFRIRRDDVTEAFTHELGMVWRGRKYALNGVGYPNLAEIEIYAIPTTENYEQTPP